MSFSEILFILATLLVLGSTVLLLLTKNLIHSCVYLLGTLIGVAGLFLTLGADFVAAIQILVYVGGVVILMLFAVMLTGGQEFLRSGKGGRYLIPAMGNKKSFIVGGLSALVLGLTVFRLIAGIAKKDTLTQGLPFESTVERIGTLLVTDHVLAFEVVSFLLLGALIGAAIIARPVRFKTKDE